MNKEKDATTVDDVLDYYLISSAEKETETLAEMIDSYPQYEHDLRELAAFRKIEDSVADHAYTAEEEELLHARGISVVQNLLYQKRQENASGKKPEAFSSLRDEIDRQYKSLDEFYKKTGLTEGIIWTLDDRQAAFQSIPRKAIQNIADALGKLFATVADYLQGQMQFDESYYKAEESPEAARCSFSDLVRMDDDLTQEQKAYWLTQPPIGTSKSQEEGSER